jgi:hypothetical protein
VTARAATAGQARPQPGERAPALRLPDSDCVVYDLHARAAEQRHVVIFYRGHF